MSLLNFAAMDNDARQKVKAPYKKVVKSAVEGVISIDHRGIIENISPAACLLFGYKSEEVIGQPINILMPSPYSEEHDGYMDNYQRTGIKHVVDKGRQVSGKRKNGDTFPFWLIVSELKIDGRMYFTGIIHDISDQKKTEAKLEAKVSERTEQLAQVVNKMLSTNKKLEKEVIERELAEKLLREKQMELLNALQKEKELGELKTRFISMASHEFRTPLSTIQSSSALVRRYAETGNLERQYFHLEKIRATVNNLTSILNDFLSLTKLEEGRVENKPEWIDMKALCAEIIEEIGGLTKPGQHIVATHNDAPDKIYLDPNLLKNTLFNLLSNAIKYSDKDISCDCSYSTEKILTITVKDFGIGIPESEKQYIFERFFRASNVTNIQGVGLGMNIVRHYLDIMGGKIFLESKEGQGTTFTIKFEVHEKNPDYRRQF